MAAGYCWTGYNQKQQEHECTIHDIDAGTRPNSTTLKSIAEEDPLRRQIRQMPR